MTTVDERHGDGARDGDDQGGVPRIGDPLASRFPQTAPEAPLLAPEIPRLAAEAVPLSDPRAARIPFAGSKAAHLARAALAGLPVLPGFVVPYGDWSGERAGHGDLEGLVGLRRAWQELSADGTRPLVVRSSSPQEDTQESSLAGQFASVLDVQGWHEFRAAVRTVLDSAHRPDGTVAPMAVLVQPVLAARVGGVMLSAVGAALVGALVVGLADLTQTREEDAKNSEATSLLLKVDMRGTNMTAERESLAAHQLWERCRDSTSVPLNRATLGTLGDGLFAGVVQPALTDHDRMRLRGCLEDTGLDRTHLTVVGIGDADADDD